MTAASMRSLAAQLRGCTPELARLGAPTDRLQPVYELAQQGCAQLEEAAKSLVAAAGIHVVGPGTALNKMKKQLDNAVAATNKASELLANAAALGMEIQLQQPQ